MSSGDSIDTNYNGWTGRYFDSVQAGNPLMASIQGVPWQVRGTDPASSYDTLDWFASGMQGAPSAADGSSQPAAGSAAGAPSDGICGKVPDWLKPYTICGLFNGSSSPLAQFGLGTAGFIIGLALVVLGIIFFLKD